MCCTCSKEYDKNLMRSNRESCYLCGGPIDDDNEIKTYAYMCDAHEESVTSSNLIFCSVCQEYSFRNAEIKPIMFQLCYECGLDRRCCYLRI